MIISLRAMKQHGDGGLFLHYIHEAMTFIHINT